MWDSIFSTHHGNALLSATADRFSHNMSQRDIKGNVGAPLLRGDVQGQTLTLAVTDVCNSHKQSHGDIPPWSSNENAITYADRV